MLIIGQISVKEALEAHFGISFTDKQQYHPDYFIEQQKEAIVITSKKKQYFTFMNYGMIPFWSRHFLLHCEAPVEGEGVLAVNNILKKRIVLHPSFRRPIRESRCLIPADYLLFPTREGNVYMIYSASGRPFAMAGVYDSWKESYRDEVSYEGFSILTVPGNDILKLNNIENVPLILSPEEYKIWLNCDLPLTEITALMKIPSRSSINGHPVNRELFINKVSSSELLHPAGEYLLPNYDMDNGKFSMMLRTFGLKRGPAHSA